MDDYLSEKEQIERLKKWWSENGSFVIAGIVLGGAILFGWNKWQDTIRNKAETASGIYNQLIQASNEKDKEQAIALSRQLKADYASTPYADQGLLAVAKLHVDASEFEDAAARLEEVVSTTSDSQLEKIARVRWARILLELGNGEKALSVLSGEPGERFAGLYHEVRGDAYVLQGDFGSAQKEYEDALNAQSQGLGDRALLEMKIADLPVQTETTDPEDAG